MWTYLQELDYVAGAEDAMSSGELERIVWREIRRQNTFVDAAAAQNLAGGARADHDGLRRRRVGRGGRWGVDGVAALHLSVQRKWGEKRKKRGSNCEGERVRAEVIYRRRRKNCFLWKSVLCLHIPSSSIGPILPFFKYFEYSFKFKLI